MTDTYIGFVNDVMNTDNKADLLDALDKLSQTDINVTVQKFQEVRAHMFLALPEGMTEDQLEEVLENISDDLMVSVLVDE